MRSLHMGAARNLKIRAAEVLGFRQLPSENYASERVR